MDAPRPLITQVRATHFKSLGDLSLDLGPLTVLVGPNGSGKSNVVAVLRFLRDVATRGLRHAFGEQGGSPTIPQRGHDCVSVGVTWSFGAGSVAYDLALSMMSSRLVGDSRLEKSARLGESFLGLKRESIRFPGQLSDRVSVELDGSDPTSLLSLEWDDASLLSTFPFTAGLLDRRGAGIQRREQLVGSLEDDLKRIGVYNLTPSLLRGVQRETYSEPFEEDGRNLAATLATIRQTSDGDTIDRVLELLVDGAIGYHVEHTAGLLLPRIDYAGLSDGQATASDLGLESDGTIRMMAILAALYQWGPRSLVVLEEPEAGLHPGALSILADIVKEVSTRCQVVITTHSPDLIDCFDLDTLRVVEKIDGETRVGPVRPAQQQAVRRKLFSPGELMRMEGLQLDIG